MQTTSLGGSRREEEGEEETAGWEGMAGPGCRQWQLRTRCKIGTWRERESGLVNSRYSKWLLCYHSFCRFFGTKSFREFRQFPAHNKKCEWEGDRAKDNFTKGYRLRWIMKYSRGSLLLLAWKGELLAVFTLNYCAKKIVGTETSAVTSTPRHQLCHRTNKACVECRETLWRWQTPVERAKGLAVGGSKGSIITSHSSPWNDQ